MPVHLKSPCAADVDVFYARRCLITRGTGSRPFVADGRVDQSLD